ncbi:MAG: phospholipase D family protein [Candidatus Saganbacteria bacterium]|nr:phospholipase D family protein [Candidatus Saganbacteria bacterium]
MKFYLQDPTIPYSYTLHEALLQACVGAESGGGAYAFVSQDGVKLLLEDMAFRSFVESGSFKLVVGIDEITNENALKRLRELRDTYKGLDIVAFLHDVKGALFHPKFTWFKNNRGGMLIVGSGNLTARGLRRNWEAFSTVQLDKQEIRKIESDWNGWIAHQAKYLKGIDDEAVLEQAKSNLWGRRVRKLEKELPQELVRVVEQQWQAGEVDEDTEAWDFTDLDDVLVAEIPRSGNRWNQANFDIDTFKSFFGAKPGDNSQRILLRHVKNDGLLSKIEIRPSVSVVSQNYRFELEAAAGLDYPTGGRPIGLFIRVSSRMFLYLIAMPSDAYYSSVSSFLDSKSIAQAGRVKRIRTNVQELKEKCADLPFWKIVK